MKRYEDVDEGQWFRWTCGTCGRVSQSLKFFTSPPPKEAECDQCQARRYEKVNEDR